jgi:hypothetical protein
LFLMPVSLARLEMGHLATTTHTSVQRTLRAWVPLGMCIIMLGRPLPLAVAPSLLALQLVITRPASVCAVDALVSPTEMG